MGLLLPVLAVGPHGPTLLESETKKWCETCAIITIYTSKLNIVLFLFISKPGIIDINPLNG